VRNNGFGVAAAGWKAAAGPVVGLSPGKRTRLGLIGLIPAKDQE